MMRNLCIILVLFFAFAKAYSQPKFNTTVKDQQSSANLVVQEFFTAFHQKDTSLIKSMFIKDPTLLSVSVKNGNQTLTKTDLTSLLDSLANIPDNVTFKEELISISDLSELYISTVSTPYIFSVNGKVSHKGTNVFTLFNMNGHWKIAAIADSRVYE